ncbi:putative multiple sugar transport system permease protein [Lachnospiraceae bacterium PF1-21]|uniref:Xylose transport system permease protein XylH n=1 Tax=Ohessyouella blattaphilus TaxID=2949333 RepID=A0ABT1EI60_9FIRM|nr:multiple monosaccharide ABC transporter permease [Ohessyouella blattaphilus]MCP1108992.1 sugar ABC transporter permease [Ohessyouella blattaphilus]MCR8562386.1 sugar ABC transporter permease [Ohessyouella blattaphilus]MDL2251083.1 sugar ABC transporter permease [Lachnospiraceae bacterium OttesenSCG-928-J05]
MDKAKVSTFFKKYTMVIVLVIVMLLFTWQTGGKLLLPQNINNLILQNAYVFVLATGMLLCILTGGNIDLSVGSVVCFVGAVGATLMVKNNVNVFLSIVIMLAVGLLIGIWQGFWIAYRRIPPFIVTLAGMLMFRGMSNIVLQGYTIAPMPQGYLNLFNSYIVDFFQGDGFNITSLVVGILAAAIYTISRFRQRFQRLKKGYDVDNIGTDILRCVVMSAVMIALMWRLAMYKGIPNILLWIGIIVLIYAYITSKTTVGRHFYAVGGNEKAAKLSGINTNRVYFLAYANMGLLAAVAAMVTIARLNSANPTAGDSYEMDAIGSCFIGGASAYGGSGTIPGVIIGATLMGVINLGMSIMGIDANWQKVVKGLVLLAAVIFDVESKKNSR